MSGRVLVVGSVNVDHVATVERLPSVGETVTGATFARHHGGKGGNQATAAARLGARVAFVGAVGDDPLGGRARAALAGEGVDVAELATVCRADRRRPDPRRPARRERSPSRRVRTPPSRRSCRSAALNRLGLGPDDVVLVGHEIPTRGGRRGAADGPRAGATGRSSTRRRPRACIVRSSGWPTSSFRTAASSRSSPAGAASRPIRRGDFSTRGPITRLAMAIVVTLARAERLIVLARQNADRQDPGAPVETVDAVGAGRHVRRCPRRGARGGSGPGDRRAARRSRRRACRRPAAAPVAACRPAHELERVPRRALTFPPSPLPNVPAAAGPSAHARPPGAGGHCSRGHSTGALCSRAGSGDSIQDDRQRGPAATPPNGRTRRRSRSSFRRSRSRSARSTRRSSTARRAARPLAMGTRRCPGCGTRLDPRRADVQGIGARRRGLAIGLVFGGAVGAVFGLTHATPADATSAIVAATAAPGGAIRYWNQVGSVIDD